MTRKNSRVLQVAFWFFTNLCLRERTQKLAKEAKNFISSY